MFFIGDLNNGISKTKHIKLLKKYIKNIPIIKPLKCYNCKLKTYCYSFKALCPSNNYYLFKNMHKRTKIRCIYL